jgi:biopolymer transport protein ExbB/TolQ
MDLLELLWSNNTAAGRTIIFIIVVLGAIGSLCALRHWLRYHSTERNWLQSVRDALRRAQEARQAGSGDEPSTAGPLIDLQELAQTVPRDTLIGDRLATILNMKQARVKVNIDALQQSSVLKESANWSLALPAYVVSLAMMLGLLGTFIGLSLMVADIQRAMPDAATHADASQWAASVGSLGKILAGKKTAFSATLAGLFCSIIVSALNFALARAQSAFYDRLERFTSEELLPATVPAFDDETPWEKLSMQLGDSFEHLDALTSEQSRSVQQMAAVEKTFGTVIGNIESITQRAATAPLQGMAGEISSVIAQLAAVNGAIVAMTERLPQIVSAFRSAQDATLGEIHGSMQTQNAAIERVARAIQNQPARGGVSGLGFAAAGASAVLVVILILARLA